MSNVGREPNAFSDPDSASQQSVPAPVVLTPGFSLDPRYYDQRQQEPFPQGPGSVIGQQDLYNINNPQQQHPLPSYAPSAPVYSPSAPPTTIYPHAVGQLQPVLPHQPPFLPQHHPQPQQQQQLHAQHQPQQPQQPYLAAPPPYVAQAPQYTMYSHPPSSMPYAHYPPQGPYARQSLQPQSAAHYGVASYQPPSDTSQLFPREQHQPYHTPQTVDLSSLGPPHSHVPHPHPHPRPNAPPSGFHATRYGVSGQGVARSVDNQLVRERSAPTVSPTARSRSVTELEYRKEAARKAFEQADRDGSNSLDPREFMEVLQGLGYSINYPEALRLFGNIDMDMNGKIGLTEFQEFYLSLNHRI